MHRKIILASLIALGATWMAGIDEPVAETRKSITPLFMVNVQSESNFYKTTSFEIDAWTTVLQPGLEAEIETERSYASVFYTLDAYFYSGLDEDLDFVGHTFKLDTGSRSRSENLRVNLRDTYNRTRDPAELDYLGNSVSTSEFSINRFSPELLYHFGRATLKLGYNNIRINYRESLGGEDSVENRAIIQYGYRFDRANAIDLNYQYWTVNYDGFYNDYDSQQAKVSYERQGKKLLLQAGTGWQGRTFDDGSQYDINNFAWDFMLRTKGMQKTELIFRADGNLNSWSSGSGYYNATKLALTVNRDIVANLQGRFYGTYLNSNYEFIDRDDDTWSFEISLAYTVTRWMAVAGAVGSENRDSSLDTEDYDNVYGFAMLSFVYPIGTGTPKISPSPYYRR